MPTEILKINYCLPRSVEWELTAEGQKEIFGGKGKCHKTGLWLIVPKL